MVVPEWSSDATGGLHEANVNGHSGTGWEDGKSQCAGWEWACWMCLSAAEGGVGFLQGEPYDRLPIPQWLALHPWTYGEY